MASRQLVRSLPRLGAMAQTSRLHTTCRFNEQGVLSSLLHGSPEAKAEGAIVEQSHSKMVARNKYVHHIIRHRVKPGKVEEYRKLIGGYYKAVAERPELEVKHTGSWEVIIGELDNFIHITEYDNGYAGFGKTRARMHETPEWAEFVEKVLPLIDSRTSFIGQEFAFWATSPPQVLGGLYEMRTYHLKPGSLLEWEIEWRRGLEARRQHHQPIAAFFSQLGDLHQVTHIWHYKDLQSRKESRDKAWSISGWAETVSKTVKLTMHMQSEIMLPCNFSPLR